MVDVLIVGIVKERGCIIAFVINGGLYDKDDVVSTILLDKMMDGNMFTYLLKVIQKPEFCKNIIHWNQFSMYSS